MPEIGDWMYDGENGLWVLKCPEGHEWRSAERSSLGFTEWVMPYCPDCGRAGVSNR